MFMPISSAVSYNFEESKDYYGKHYDKSSHKILLSCFFKKNLYHLKISFFYVHRLDAHEGQMHENQQGQIEKTRVT